MSQVNVHKVVQIRLHNSHASFFSFFHTIKFSPEEDDRLAVSLVSQCCRQILPASIEAIQLWSGPFKIKKDKSMKQKSVSLRGKAGKKERKEKEKTDQVSLVTCLGCNNRKYVSSFPGPCQSPALVNRESFFFF